MKAVFFQVPLGWGPSRLRKAMTAHFADVSRQAVRSAALSVYDTFDWRLYQKGQTLVQADGFLRILQLKTGADLASVPFTGKALPRFWREYPKGAFRDVLSAALGIRGLMLRFAAHQTTTAMGLCNAEKKTVVRLSLDALTTGGGTTHTTLALIPIRGYRREKAAAMAILAAQGCFPLAEHGLVAAMQDAGSAPGGDQARPDLPLTPETAAGDAVQMLLQHLAGVMRANEDGIRGDIDTEFLHDFRVAVRRSRSLLSLTSGVVPPPVGERLKADLRTVGKATNAQRDLDVYLLDQRTYEQLLPEGLRPALQPLFASMRRRRAAALKKTTAFLASDAYRQALRRLEDPATADGDADAPLARTPVTDVARQLITARYRKVVGTGRRITPGTSDKKRHRLRIYCKQLRYALEFFAPLFPPEEMVLLIKQLKKLQDHLGRFNDLAVQQDFLAAYLNGLKPAAAGSLASAAAAGGLIGILHHQQRRLRAGFPDAFTAFDSPDNAARYERLTAGKELPE